MGAGGGGSPPTSPEVAVTDGGGGQTWGGQRGAAGNGDPALRSPTARPPAAEQWGRAGEGAGSGGFLFYIFSLSFSSPPLPTLFSLARPPEKPKAARDKGHNERSRGAEGAAG